MKILIIVAAAIMPLFALSQAEPPFDSLAITNGTMLVDKEARFPGGAAGWQKYLEHNLNSGLAGKYIRLKRKEKVGQQTVRLQFLVSKEGKIYDVKTINILEVHPKLAREAERAIKAGPDWIPAEKAGTKVLYQATQNITFQVARE